MDVLWVEIVLIQIKRIQKGWDFGPFSFFLSFAIFSGFLMQVKPEEKGINMVKTGNIEFIVEITIWGILALGFGLMACCNIGYYVFDVMSETVVNAGRIGGGLVFFGSLIIGGLTIRDKF